MAGDRLEPGLTGSKPAVLPIKLSPIIINICLRISNIINIFIQQMKILDGKLLAKNLNNKLSKKYFHITKNMEGDRTVMILVGNNPPVRFMLKIRKKSSRGWY